MNIRITKEFDFEAAHALDGYEGKCKDIHGHSYHLKITLIGEPSKDVLLSDCGMVVDFGEIKSIVREQWILFLQSRQPFHSQTTTRLCWAHQLV